MVDKQNVLTENQQTELMEREVVEHQPPSYYRVLLLNDDFTPMDFVVEILCEVFNKSEEEALRVMLHVHNHGVGVCGVYTYDVAETKLALVLNIARHNTHPLQGRLEKVDEE